MSRNIAQCEHQPTAFAGEGTWRARARRPAAAPDTAAMACGGSSRLSREVASLRCDEEKDAVLATRIDGVLSGVAGVSGACDSSSFAANASASSLCLLSAGPAQAQNMTSDVVQARAGVRVQLLYGVSRQPILATHEQSTAQARAMTGSV